MLTDKPGLSRLQKPEKKADGFIVTYFNETREYHAVGTRVPGKILDEKPRKEFVEKVMDVFKTRHGGRVAMAPDTNDDLVIRIQVPSWYSKAMLLSLGLQLKAIMKNDGLVKKPLMCAMFPPRVLH